MLSDRLLRPILLTAVAWNLSWFVLQAAYVPYAVRTMHLSAAGVGSTLACYGTGMLAGALLAPRVTRTVSFGTAIVVGPAASLVAAGAMTATILAPSAGLAGTSFFLFGAGPIVWTVTQMTLRQTVTPERLLGQVSAVFMTATTGARPVGAAIGAALGAAFGPALCIEAAGLGFLLQLLIIARSPAARLASPPRPGAVVWRP